MRMLRLSALVAVLVFAGCAHVVSTPSAEVLQQMPERIRGLHPETDSRPIPEQLGLRQSDVDGIKGGGPQDHYRISYGIGGGHSCCETWDTTKKPARLLMVRFDHYVWTAEAQQ